MTLPPDRSHLLTEQRNPRSLDLHQRSIAECVRLIQDEDRAVLEAVEQARPALIAFLEDAEPRFANGRLIYLGAGTSGRLGVLDASESPPTFQVDPSKVIGIIAGGDAALRRSSEGKEDDPAGARAELSRLSLTANDIVVGIAAGGTTPYVLGALEWVRALPEAPLTALVTCTRLDPAPAVDHLIVAATGPEVITGSTRMKAGTATKLLLNTISTTLMIRAGKVFENLMVDVRATNEKLRDRAARIIATLTGLDRTAAFALLDQAGGVVKIAILMHRLACSRERAQQALDLAHGRLDQTLFL